MADPSVPNLDLAQILQTLASLPQAPGSSTAPQPHQHPQSLQPLQPHPHPPTLPLHHCHPPPQRPPSKAPTPRPPPTDPTTITTWKHGLRSVTHTATHSPPFIPTIRRLIADQSRNTSDWALGHQRLLAEQAAKRESERTHRAALSLPGLLGEDAPLLRTREREEEEVREYWGKVHRACRKMVEAQGRQLAGAGVPFFGVREGLVEPEGFRETGVGDAHGEEEEGGGKVTKKELLELQRKMLRHLMELYGD